MILRRAKISDSKLFFILRNQSDTRKFSINKNKIPHEKHERWYELNFQKKNNFFFVIVFKNKDIGYLRLEKKQKFYYVSICVSKHFRKFNIAFKTLSSLSRYIKKNKILIAEIDLKNISSINLFIKSGFKVKMLKKNNLTMIKKI